MAARFHPLEDGLWDHPKLEGASFEEHGFFAFLSANRRQRPSGIYRMTDEQAAADTTLALKTVRAYLSDLAARERIVRDGAWVFVAGYFKRQPKTPKLLAAVERDVRACTSRRILEAFSLKYPVVSKWCRDGLETIGGRSGDRPSTGTGTGTGTGTREGEGVGEGEGGGEPSGWGTPEALVGLYNTLAPDNCPAVESLSTRRRAQARAALRQFPDRAWWEACFQEYRRSKFLSGRVGPSEGHTSFKPDFDWLLSNGKDGAENYVKVHDGRYADD